jgi:DNA-binding GntR family transcriptional regulator
MEQGPGQTMGTKLNGNDEARGETVYRSLRQAIIEQALLPGTKLPEDAIGARFGVSRTVVRRALSRLEVDGLVEFRLNRGAAVARPGLEEAREIFALRAVLEGEVIRKLAGRLSGAQAAALTAHVDGEAAARRRGGPESIRLAGEFHILLADLTGNGVLTRYVGELVSRCSLILAAYARPHSPDCAIDEHRRLIALLSRGDAEAAVEEMARHIGGVEARADLGPERAPPDLDAVLVRYAPTLLA